MKKMKKHETIPRGVGLVGGLLAGAMLVTGMTFAATEPVISTVVASPTSTGATITWTTDENANAQVLYGTSTPPYTASTTPTIGFTTTTQSVALTGLTPSTTYHYAVVSSDASSSMNSSSDATFMTTAAPATDTAMISPGVATGTPASSFTLNGSGFWNSEAVNISFDGATSSANADTNGNFAQTLMVPSTSVSTDTPETITASGVTSGMTATTTFTIVPAAATSTPTSTITLNPTSGLAGSSFSLIGLGFTPNEAVTIDFNGTTSTVNADASGNVSTTVMVPAGAMSGNVWVTATGATSGSVAGQWFLVEQSGGGSTTTIATLQAEITQLQTLVSQLIAEVQSLLNGNGGSGGNGNGGNPYPPTNGAATIDPVGPVRAGTSVDFTGRNWGTNEQVRVTDNGSVVTTAQADGGGNFSTGSLPVTNATGTQTYVFTGLTSGFTNTVTLTVTP